MTPPKTPTRAELAAAALAAADRYARDAALDVEVGAAQRIKVRTAIDALAAPEAAEPVASPLLKNLQTWLCCKLIGNAARPEAETIKAWVVALAPLTGEAAPEFAKPDNSRCKFASGGARCVSHCGDPICVAAPLAQAAPPRRDSRTHDGLTVVDVLNIPAPLTQAAPAERTFCNGSTKFDESRSEDWKNGWWAGHAEGFGAFALAAPAVTAQALTPDTARRIAREAATSASDPASDVELVRAGWNAALAATPAAETAQKFAAAFMRGHDAGWASAKGHYAAAKTSAQASSAAGGQEEAIWAKFLEYANRAGHFREDGTTRSPERSTSAWSAYQVAWKDALAAQAPAIPAAGWLPERITDDWLRKVLRFAGVWPDDDAPHAMLGPVRGYAEAMRLAGSPASLRAWMPIETAPKDGTRVILTNGESTAEGSWLHAEPYIRERRDPDGRYIDQDESDGFDGWIDSIGGMTPDPTHWMPLPAPAIPAPASTSTCTPAARPTGTADNPCTRDDCWLQERCMGNCSTPAMGGDRG